MDGAGFGILLVVLLQSRCLFEGKAPALTSGKKVYHRKVFQLRILTSSWVGSRLDRLRGTRAIQGLAKLPFQGSQNFVPAVAYQFCLNLPAAFSQPGNGNLAKPSVKPQPVRMPCLAPALPLLLEMAKERRL